MADRQYYQRVNEILDQSSGSLPEPEPPGPPRAWPIRRWLRRGLIWIVAVVCLVYVTDWAQARYRMTTNTALGSVTIDRYSVIHQKNNRMEFNYLDSEKRACLRSLFPHSGYAPCWYAQRHTEQRIDY